MITQRNFLIKRIAGTILLVVSGSELSQTFTHSTTKIDGWEESENGSYTVVMDAANDH